MRKVICSAGTSILSNASKTLGNEARSLSTKAQIDQYVKKLKRETPDRDEFLRKLCAETHSLARLRVAPGDEVTLLHTETNEGRVSAEAVRDVLQEEFKVSVQIREVEGLQVSDANRFRKEGLYHLFTILHQEAVDWPQESPEERTVIINATGGFKAVVPYLTLFGLFNRLEVVYIFEQSETLIRLPPLPVQFDYERLGQARSAFQKLIEEGPMPKEQFFQAIRGLRYEDRQWFEPLLEEDERGDVTLSAIGFYFLDRWKQDVKTVFLSPEAQAVYENSRNRDRELLTEFLQKLGDPLWRQHHTERGYGTDLAIYRITRGDRALGFVSGDRVYVCLIYLSHDEYERDLREKKHWRSSFEGRLHEFQPWTAPEVEYRPPTDVPDDYESLERALEEAKQKASEYEKERDQLMERIATLENEKQEADRQSRAREEELTARLDDTQRQLNQLTNEKHELQEQVKTLQQTVAWASRPWWRKLLGLPPCQG